MVFPQLPLNMEPRVQINDVYLTEQDFSWDLTQGSRPYLKTIVVPNDINEKLKVLENPVTLSCVCFGGFGSYETVDIKVNNVYLVEPKRLDPYHVSWILVDKRYLWRGTQVYGNWNATRVQNAFGSSNTSVADAPSVLRQDFDLFGVGRYLPHTINQVTEKRFTVLEVLVDILRLYPYLNVIPPTSDESYILENIEFDGEEMYNVLDYLTQASRLGMSLDLDGNVYFYSIDEYSSSNMDFIRNAQEERNMKGTVCYLQDKKRLRPTTVTVRYKKKEEVWLTNDLRAKLGVWSEDDVKKKRVIGIQNVVPVPFPARYGGEERKVGEYILMDDFLEEVEISERKILSGWFGHHLETSYIYKLMKQAGDIAIGNKRLDQYGRSVMATMRQHFRQTFQIDPAVFNYIESFEARRVGIVDTYSHFSPPSPLFIDYTIFPAKKNSFVAKRLANWQSDAVSWNVDEQDPFRFGPTVGTITVLNQALGVFRIELPSLSFSTIDELIPFRVLAPPERAAGVTINAGTLTKPTFLDKCELAREYQVQTIISVIWKADPVSGLYDSERRYFDFSYAMTDGDGPLVTKLDTTEFARFGISTKTEYESVDQGAIELKPSGAGMTYDIMNKTIVEALSKSACKRVLQQYKDFYTGQVVLGGLVLKKFFGNMDKVCIHFRPQDGLTTTIVFKDVTPYSLENTLDQTTLAYIKKQVSGGLSSGAK